MPLLYPGRQGSLVIGTWILLYVLKVQCLSCQQPRPCFSRRCRLLLIGTGGCAENGVLPPPGSHEVGTRTEAKITGLFFYRWPGWLISFPSFPSFPIVMLPLQTTCHGLLDWIRPWRVSPEIGLLPAFLSPRTSLVIPKMLNWIMNLGWFNTFALFLLLSPSLPPSSVSVTYRLSSIRSKLQLSATSKRPLPPFMWRRS